MFAQLVESADDAGLLMSLDALDVI